MSNMSRLFYCTLILTCLLGQHVDTILTEGINTCTIMMNSFKDDLLKLQLELYNVKDRLDRTESDNAILRNRVDILSHENYKIRGQLRRMLSMENKIHKTFKEVIEDTDSLNGYSDQLFQYGDAKLNTDTHFILPELGQMLNNKFKPKYDRDLEDSNTTTTSTGKPPQTTTQATTTTQTSSTTAATTTTPAPPIITQPPVITTPSNLERVGFSVGLSKTVPLGFIEMVHYDRVFMNVGNGYDVNKGSFIVPVPGVYLFYFSALNKPGHNAYIELVQNGVRLAIINLGDTDYNMGSQIVMVYVGTGDLIWVRNASSAGPILYGNAHEQYNTFSGFLLYKSY